MQKVFLFLLLFLLPLAETPSRVPVSEPVSVASTPETDEVDQLFDDMHLDGIVSYTAFRQAVTGYRKIEQKSKSIMTLIDFSKPSTEKRLYVLDMKNKKLLYTSVVSHGRNSGENYATSFSNKNGSYKSSLGFYLTENTYQGRNGYSLVLNGLEKGINDQAKQRAIVMHGAASAGRLGRSLGCPALPQALAKPIIDTIKKGSVLFIYANNKDYLANSTFLSPRQTEYLSWAQSAN
ncbi:murein L,D-transpeptidase catalytic domain family protein [Bacteroides fragilis]|nr:murein L,D-transpeptidase catalytic domain family protein [Bacteroides fragilis]